MASKVTLGELKDEAEARGINLNQFSDMGDGLYQELRDKLPIYTCDWCDDENLHPYSERFCSDTCEVHYINEYHK